MASKSAVHFMFRLSSNVRWIRFRLNSATCFGNGSQKSYSSWSSRINLKRNIPYGYISLSLTGFSTLLYHFLKKENLVKAEQKADNSEDTVVPGKFIDGLPMYKYSDIEKHKSKEERIWVTFKNGVYDVTDFIGQHPGGNKILLAAGSAIEPFWSLYGVHNQPEVYKMLEEYRIGNLDAQDKREFVDLSDPYSNDPIRHPVMKPASVKPFNAEPPLSLLVDNFYTPNELFYIRNHLPVPVVDETNYRLEVKGIGVKTRSFTLAEIKKLPKYTISATMYCAGNRRSEMSSLKPTKGLQWNQGAIGNATWSGARLIDVLEKCKFTKSNTLEHVQFIGMDKGPDNQPYGASIPAFKVLDPNNDVILAYEMNGKELSRDHGYPLRVIAPGIVGARNVKWLSKIILSDKESDSHWQQNDYKVFSPSTNWDKIDFMKSPAIQELPVNSAICTPEEGETVTVVDGIIVVKGYAWSGGGNYIARVDVTADKGKTWQVADLEQIQTKNSKNWSWALWTAAVPVSSDSGNAEIWVKAVDSSNNTQPESFDHIWNIRGLLANAYHKIHVKLSES